MNPVDYDNERLGAFREYFIKANCKCDGRGTCSVHHQFDYFEKLVRVNERLRLGEGSECPAPPCTNEKSRRAFSPEVKHAWDWLYNNNYGAYADAYAPALAEYAAERTEVLEAELDIKNLFLQACSCKQRPSKAGSAETGGEKAAPAKNAAMEIWPRGAFESEEQFAARVQRISATISRHYQPMVDELAELRKRGTVGKVYGFDCEETSGCASTGEMPAGAKPISVALAESSLSQKCDVCHLTLDDMGNCFNCSSELDSDQKRDAKKRCNICGDKKCICDEYGHQNPHNSEPSLSSPPPKCEHLRLSYNRKLSRDGRVPPRVYYNCEQCPAILEHMPNGDMVATWDKVECCPMCAGLDRSHPVSD
jgi:hypothetical protein